MINHRVGIENKTVDTLRRLTVTLHRMSAHVIRRLTVTLHRMSTHVIGFDILEYEYSACPDFGIIYDEVSHGNRHEYVDFFFC